jgi:hypothetical protein
MRSVETILEMGGEGDKREWWGAEFNYDIL